MQQFRVRAETQIVNFTEHVHAKLLSLRGDHEVVVGVFQLHPGEWAAFQEICANGNIEIIYEPTRTTVPTEG